MEVNQTTSTEIYLTGKKQRDPVKVLDKDAFLQIMIAQLRYQDPSSPMDSGKFIEQMAMFTTLEQITNLNSNIEKLYQLQELSHASSLIGKRVNLLTEESQVIGEVERVTMGDNSLKIWVSGKPYDLSQVIAVERGVINEPEELPEVPADNTEPEQQPAADAEIEQPNSEIPESESVSNEPSEADESTI